MKIAVDARTLGSRPSGVGMYLNDFLKVLMTYEDLEFVLISDVAVSEYIKYFESCGIKVMSLGKSIYRSAGVIEYFKFVKKCLKVIDPDIFWEVNTCIPVRLTGRYKIMITIHDMFPIEYPEYFGKVYSLYFNHCLKLTLKHSDMILYNSNQTKITTEKYYPQAAKIANCNAYIIANPLKDKWETCDKGYLLYVGNMEKRKGVDLLLKGYRRYKEMGGEKELLLAGKMQEEDIQNLLNETQAAVDGITYYGYVKHDEKHKLFSECSCFVFPSKAEGFGMPIIEVMKFAKPILVGKLDIYTEITGDVLNTFDMNVSEEGQIQNLADAMLGFNSDVDVEAYEKVIARYAPDRLGKLVHDFVLSNMEGS